MHFFYNFLIDNILLDKLKYDDFYLKYFIYLKTNNKIQNCKNTAILL